MITITKIKTEGQSKLIGEINNKSYCISHTDELFTKLTYLSEELNKCESEKEWLKNIEIAESLVTDVSYRVLNSKYFSKISEVFFLSFNNKYYNIPDKNGIINRILNYYIDKGLNIDKFAAFIAREGNSKLLNLDNIYHKLNANGNIRSRINGNLISENIKYYVEGNKIRKHDLSYNRWFLNKIEITSDTEYSLKSLGSSISDIFKSDEEGTPVLIKPDLTCYVGELETEGLLVDPDNNTNWDNYITQFIDLHGQKH